MGLFNFFEPSSSFESELCKIDGLQLINGKAIALNPNVSLATINQLLSLLHQHQISFSFYDALYPSVSDPGAYFKYQPTATPLTFLLTLANHGWSGGIYEITEITIAQQLFNLIGQNHLHSISIDKVKLFSRHPLQDVAQNLKQNQLIYKLHANTTLG